MNNSIQETGAIEFEVGSLYEGLQGLKDRRKASGKRYDLVLILTLSVIETTQTQIPHHSLITMLFWSNMIHFMGALGVVLMSETIFAAIAGVWGDRWPWTCSR